MPIWIVVWSGRLGKGSQPCSVGAQLGSLIGQNVGVRGSKLLKQACRTLDIGEEERDRPGWKI